MSSECLPFRLRNHWLPKGQGDVQLLLDKELQKDQPNLHVDGGDELTATHKLQKDEE